MEVPPIRYATTDDGQSIAYSVAGSGPTLVRVQGWFTHIEHEWPWGHLPWERLAEHFRIVLYDGRGFGMSDRDVDEFSAESESSALDAVVKALGEPEVALLGTSAGGATAIRYAASHAETVTHLTLLGSGSDEPAMRTEEGLRGMAEFIQGLASAARSDWELGTPAFRQTFTTLYMPEATLKDYEQFNKFRRASGSGETVAKWWESRGDVSRGIGDIAQQVTQPTLVMRRQGDALSSASGAHYLTRLIPNARFVPMKGRNHFFLAREPELETFITTLRAFLSEGPAEPQASSPQSLQTIMFTDLESSTALTQRVGDEAAQGVLHDHNEAFRAALSAHGGREVKQTGDGIMAAFPSAVRAVEAAL